MAKTKKSKNRSYRYRSSQGMTGPRMIVGAVVVLFLLIGGFYLLRDDPPQLAASTETVVYDPAEVAYDEGLVGTHEMDTLPTSPTLLPSDGPQPSLEIPQDYWSFGNIGAKDVVDHTFVLRNTGDAPLTISRIYTTCACTRGELTARVIPPGKVALVRVVFDAGFHDARGQQVRRGVIIESNDPTKSEASVWVEASVGW